MKIRDGLRGITGRLAEASLDAFEAIPGTAFSVAGAIGAVALAELAPPPERLPLRITRTSVSALLGWTLGSLLYPLTPLLLERIRASESDPTPQEQIP